MTSGDSRENIGARGLMWAGETEFHLFARTTVGGRSAWGAAITIAMHTKSATQMHTRMVRDIPIWRNQLIWQKRENPLILSAAPSYHLFIFCSSLHFGQVIGAVLRAITERASFAKRGIWACRFAPARARIKKYFRFRKGLAGVCGA